MHMDRYDFGHIDIDSVVVGFVELAATALAFATHKTRYPGDQR